MPIFIEILLGAIEDGFIAEEAGKIILKRAFGKEITSVKQVMKLFNAKGAKGVAKAALKGSDITKAFDAIKNLPKEMKKDVVNELNKYGKLFNKKKKGNEFQNVEMIFNFDGQIALSSSFLQYGIFEVNQDNKHLGKLTLAMSGSEYDMGVVKTTIWLAMVQAVGSNGSGAGSVLWDTLWYGRRKKTLRTGGVAQSIEKLILRRRSTNLRVARNTNYVNKLAAGYSPIQKAAQRQRRQRIAKTFKLLK